MKNILTFILIIIFFNSSIENVFSKNTCLAPNAFNKRQNIFQNFLYEHPKMDVYLKARGLTLDIHIDSSLKEVLLEEYIKATPKIKNDIINFENILANEVDSHATKSQLNDYEVNQILKNVRENNAPLFFYIVQDNDGKYCILRTSPEIKDWFQVIKGRNVDTLIRKEIKTIESKLYTFNTIAEKLLLFIFSSGIMISITWLGIIYSLPPVYFILNFFLNGLYALIYIFFSSLHIHENYITYRSIFFATISAAFFSEQNSFIVGILLQLFSLYQFYNPTIEKLKPKGKIYNMYTNIFMKIFKDDFNPDSNNNNFKNFEKSLKYYFKQLKKLVVIKFFKKINFIYTNFYTESYFVLNKSS